MQQHMQGTLTAADSHGYFSHGFEVPEGATRLDIDFRYSPKRLGKYGNLLTLSVFDPLGERGTAHRQEPNQHLTLSASEATPIIVTDGVFRSVRKASFSFMMVSPALINWKVAIMLPARALLSPS